MRVLVNTADPFSSFFTRNKAAVTTESTEESKYTHFLPGGWGRAAAPAPGRGGRSRGRAGAPRFLPALQGPSGRQVHPAEPHSPPREGAGWPSLRCTSPGPAAAAPARPRSWLFPTACLPSQTQRSGSRCFSLWAHCPHPGPGTVPGTQD